MAATVRRVQATTLQANTSRTPPGDIWVFSPSFDEQKGTTHLPLLQPRWRNLWVTDTLQWRPEARLARSANPARDSAAPSFYCS